MLQGGIVQRNEQLVLHLMEVNKISLIVVLFNMNVWEQCQQDLCFFLFFF